MEVVMAVEVVMERTTSKHKSTPHPQTPITSGGPMNSSNSSGNSSNSNSNRSSSSSNNSSSSSSSSSSSRLTAYQTPGMSGIQITDVRFALAKRTILEMDAIQHKRTTFEVVRCSSITPT